MATLILLVEDVEDLGRSGDVVKVRPGYARNYIVPKKLGVTADKNALRMQERLKEQRSIKAAEDKKEAEAQAKALEGVVVTASVKVDQEGHMYGSVSVTDIVHLLAEQQKIEVEKRSVVLKHPIKVTGIHRIDLKLREGVSAGFTLKVVSENAIEGETAEEAPAQ